MGVMNQKRAAWANRALGVFAVETNMDTAGEELITIAKDLMCNICHALNQAGYSAGEIQAAHNNAFDFYEGEINDDE